MGEIESIRRMVQTTREYRNRALEEIAECGLQDLSFRPSTGMSSLGWLLTHQAAVYDFSLNILIKGQSPLKPDLFQSHTPGTSGDWIGNSLDSIQEYYDLAEGAFLDWVGTEMESDLDRVLTDEKIPKFFQGMTIRILLTHLFAHLNRHTGHLEAMRRDYLSSPNYHI